MQIYPYCKKNYTKGSFYIKGCDTAISRLGSRILPISEIQVARREIEPRTS